MLNLKADDRELVAAFEIAKRAVDSNNFRKFLEKAKKTVASWPDWKRSPSMLSLSPTVSKPRPFVDNSGAK